MTAFVVRFNLDGPLVLQHRLHLDAVLGCILGSVDNLPIVRDSSGVFRCSQAMFARPASMDGVMLQDRIQNILNVETRRFLVDCAPAIRSLPSKPDFATRSDTLTAWNVPSVRFLAETEDADALLTACRAVPAIGKWSRKGNGSVTSCALEPFTGDVWSIAGKVTRALPESVARSSGLTGLEVIEVCRPPYWSGTAECSLAPTVDPVSSYLPRLRNHVTARNKLFDVEMTEATA